MNKLTKFAVTQQHVTTSGQSRVGQACDVMCDNQGREVGVTIKIGPRKIVITKFGFSENLVTSTRIDSCSVLGHSSSRRTSVRQNLRLWNFRKLFAFIIFLRKTRSSGHRAVGAKSIGSDWRRHRIVQIGPACWENWTVSQETFVQCTKNRFHGIHFATMLNASGVVGLVSARKLRAWRETKLATRPAGLVWLTKERPGLSETFHSLFFTRPGIFAHSLQSSSANAAEPS